MLELLPRLQNSDQQGLLNSYRSESCSDLKAQSSCSGGNAPASTLSRLLRSTCPRHSDDILTRRARHSAPCGRLHTQTSILRPPNSCCHCQICPDLQPSAFRPVDMTATIKSRLRCFQLSLRLPALGIGPSLLNSQSLDIAAPALHLDHIYAQG